MSNDYAEKLILKINDLAVIKTAIRANLYMSYLARNYKSPPSKDKTDDFRHLIDASLCSYFVTDEKKLKKTCGLYNSRIKNYDI